MGKKVLKRVGIPDYLCIDCDVNSKVFDESKRAWVSKGLSSHTVHHVPSII